MENPTVVSRDAVRVCIGSRVRIRDDSEHRDEEFELAGELADPFSGLLSADSPLGRALLGHRVGERVAVRSPGGLYGVTILNVV